MDLTNIVVIIPYTEVFHDKKKSFESIETYYGVEVKEAKTRAYESLGNCLSEARARKDILAYHIDRNSIRVIKKRKIEIPVPLPVCKKRDVEQRLKELEEFGEKISEKDCLEDREYPHTKIIYKIDGCNVRAEHNIKDKNIKKYSLDIFFPKNMKGMSYKEKSSEFGDWVSSQVCNYMFNG